MNTMSNILDDIYGRLKVYSEDVVTGKVYKLKRPKNSDTEDIVIQIAGNVTSKFQQYNHLFVRVFVNDLIVGENQMPNTARFPIIEQFLLDFSNTLHSTNTYVVDLSTRQIETLSGENYTNQQEPPFHMSVLTLQIKNLIK